VPAIRNGDDQWARTTWAGRLIESHLDTLHLLP